MKIQIDNYNISYNDIGTGHVILMLHGWGANKENFTLPMNLLKDKYRVIALDLPGFGESDKLDRSFCVDDYVDIIIKFIIKLDIKELTFVGHSYGARIIIKLNSRSNLPFVIKNNVIIDGAGIKDKKDIKTKVKILFYKFSKKILYILPLSKDYKDRTLIKLKTYFGSKDYTSVDKIMQETLIKSVNEDLTEYLKNMQETLLIWGKNDTATPLWMGKLMEKEINNSGLVVLNGGHFSFIDDRVKFLSVLASYFKL